MSQPYQVLARKYRPKNFHELIGQSHVSQALINAIDYNRLHHAYLFTGTRGVGKTTIARILSKCLNCETGVTSTPCGICDNCVAIDQGRFIDLIEIDAASRTKVEDTRELLDNVPYAPSQGRYKVYLIDEVHMLSTHSFNALLKTLEEPPEHVKFLLATTDPQKLPITIISRCLQFVLRPLPQTLLSDHLANILSQEQVGYTQPAIWQLASAAKGSVRDALSLTDQAIAFGQGALDDATVNSMLGLIDAADLVSLITDIYNHDKPAVAAHIEQMRMQMVDASSMFDGLAELLHQLAMTQLLPKVALNVNEAQAQTINKLAQHISPDVLQLYYEIVVQAREGIKLASTPMQALEMCLLRLLAFRPLPTDEILVTETNSVADAYIKDDAPAPISNSEATNALAVDNNLTHTDLISTPSVDEKVAVNLGLVETVATAEVESVVEAEADPVIEFEPVVKPEFTEAIITNELEINNELEVSNEIKPSIKLEPLIESELTHQIERVGDIEAIAESEAGSEFASVAQSTIQSTAESELNELENNEFENNEFEDRAESKQGRNQPSLNVDDPRTLLRCMPQELAGEWTPEKWDYWLQGARDENLLAADQLALARQGMMTGLCNGQSTFITSVDSKHLQATFEQLAQIIQQQFVEAQVSLQIDSSVSQADNKTPERRQTLRVEQATKLAQELLLQSPVMQYLTERSEGKMGSVKLI